MVDEFEQWFFLVLKGARVHDEMKGAMRVGLIMNSIARRTGGDIKG